MFLSFHGDCHYNSLHPLRIEDKSGKPVGMLHSAASDDTSLFSCANTDTANLSQANAAEAPEPEEFSLKVEANKREKVTESDDSGSASDDDVVEGATRVRFDKRKQKTKDKGKGGDGNAIVLSKKEQRKLAKMFARQASLGGGGGEAGAAAGNAHVRVEDADGTFSGDMVVL